MTLVYMFPGQNSRYPSMIERLLEWNGTARILSDASDVLGRDIAMHYQTDNAEMFSHNRDVQVGVFLAGYIIAQRLAAEGFQSDASLGLSLGEYNHLVDIGVLSFESALRLLDARGCAYQDGPRGLMMSVFPCEESVVLEACRNASPNGSVDIGIQLSKNHFVLSGTAAGVTAAGTWLEEEVYAQARVIDPCLPMHSNLFKPAADAFKAALASTTWLSPQKAYFPNVDGHQLADAKATDFADRLYRHVFNTVRWAQSLSDVVARFPDACFIEVGPKNILFNAVRREYKKLHCLCTDDPDSPVSTFHETVRRLQGARHAS